MFSPPDEFDVADVKFMPTCVLVLRGVRESKKAQNHCAVGVTGYFFTTRCTAVDM
jgi:hypothetical protein